MYQAIYKCRLCGEEIKGNSGIYPSYQDSVPRMNANNDFGYFPETQIHACKDGSLGVADFQGFKKVVQGKPIKNIHAESIGIGGLPLVVMADVRNDILKDVTQSCFDICENAFYIGERYKDGYSKIISVCSYPLERAEKLVKSMVEHFKKDGDL